MQVCFHSRITCFLLMSDHSHKCSTYICNYGNNLSPLASSLQSHQSQILHLWEWLPFVSFSLQVNLHFFRVIFHSTTPTHAFTQILILITQANRDRKSSLETALFWGIRLTVISTAINPFIYGLLARQYRMAYIYVFRLWFSKCCGFCVDPPLKDVFGECAGSPPPTFPGLYPSL